jgi:HlyD family secretion protein
MSSPSSSLAEPGRGGTAYELRGPALRLWRWRWLRVAAPAALALGIALVAYRSVGRVHVNVARVERGTAVDAVYATGSVEAVTRVAVRARVAGSISELRVREGATVAAGDLIAIVESPGLHSQVNELESEAARARERAAPQSRVLRARAELLERQARQARADLARAEEGARAGVYSQRELEQARLQSDALLSQIALQRAEQADFDVASRADLQSAQARLESLRSRAEDTEVRAPMAGVVLWRSVELGEYVAVNQELFQIADTSTLQIEAVADESDIGRVQVGMPVAVRIPALPERPLHARVRQLFAAPDRERRAFRLDFEILDPIAGLRPGMSADCNVIIAERAEALLVPRDAVRDDKVLVVMPDGTTQERAVRVGLKDVGRSEIIEGVGAGDLLVLGSAQNLSAGTKVAYTRPGEAR